MITLDENTYRELDKQGKVAVRVVKPVVPPELVDLLQQMVRLNGTLTAALSRPKEPFPVSPPQLAPIVNVSPPTVNLSPQVTVERPQKWRFTVTKRDATAQNRIQEIVVETIE